MIRMIRDERLHIIEEEPYKRGGKVRKSKKKARKGTVRQTVIVNVGQTKPKRAVKRRRPTKRQQMMPGAPSALTGMGSVVFGAPQAPSYFRAVGPEQKTFASLPGSLKALEEGQAKLFRELERQKEQLRKDAKMARDIAEAEGEEETTRKYVSPMSSRSITPIYYSSSSAVSASPIQTLRPLERQRTDTPPIMTPSASSLLSSSIPITAIRLEPTWTGAMSSREAGYMGADETLPIQAPASGADMKPEDKVFDSAPDSAFIPLGASQPESVGDAVERAAQVATSTQAHVPSRSTSTRMVPGTNQLIVSRPKRVVPIPVPSRSVSTEKQASAPEPQQKPRKISKELQARVREVMAKRKEEQSQSGAV